MSHLNGFFVKGKWGKYFSIQTNTREGWKVVTHHVRYIGKNKIILNMIEKLQHKDKNTIKSIPLELLIDKDGQHIISPEGIQDALEKKVADMGFINKRCARWFREWTKKPKEEELTIDDLHSLVEDRINTEDQTTKAILTLTSKEGEKFLDKKKKLEELENKAKLKADNFQISKTMNSEGELVSSVKILNDAIDLDAENELIEEFDPVKQYNKIKTKMESFDKFSDPNEAWDWMTIKKKFNETNEPQLIKDEWDLIEKYYNEFGKQTKKLIKVDKAIVETKEMSKLRAEIEAYEEKHGLELNHLKNLAENGQLDEIRIDMAIEYDHRHYKQHLECLYADTKEYQALRLVKQLTKNNLEGKDKVKALFIRDEMDLNSFDGLRNVMMSHFSYKFGSEIINKSGNPVITVPHYENGDMRKIMNSHVKSGFFIKQVNKDGERESSYVLNYIDTVSRSKTSILRKKYFDVDAIKKESKEIAKIKLESENLNEKDYVKQLKIETEKAQKKLIDKFETKAQIHVAKLEKEYGKKMTKKKYHESVERAKKKLIKQFNEEFKEKKIIKITEKRLAEQKIKPGSKKYQEEYNKVKKWYEKKIRIETKKDEVNLMRKYSISKKSLSRVITYENLDFFEKVHQGNIASYENKVKEIESKKGRELTKSEKTKLYFQQNVNNMFGHYLKESQNINKVRNKKNKTQADLELSSKKTMYDRGIKNLQEFSFMLQLVSMEKGSVLEGTRTALEVFDVAQTFNSQNNKLNV